MKRFLFLTLILPLLPQFAAADWRSEADARIERIRKGDFKIEVLDAKGVPLKGAEVKYQLKRHEFLFGMAIAYGPFSDPGEDGQHYRQFIIDNFNALVCENEMKWYYNEPQRGKVDYSHADALYEFGEKNGMKMRGHNLFWEKKEFVQPWVAALNPADLRAAIDQRLTTIVNRYKGKVTCWDVNNEMLDGSFYRDHLGIEGIAGMFTEAARLAPKTALFVNEYAILGNPEKTERFINLIKELQAKGATVGGIGIQSHDSDRLTADPKAAPLGGDRPEWMMNQPLTPDMFISTLDRLYAATNLPVHLTEISAKTPDAVRRADDLEMLFRLGFSHPSVEAIMLWGFTAKTHWMGADAALVDADNKINAAGQRISHLLREEWTTHGSATASKKGQLAWRGFYGTYTVTVKMPDGHTSVSEVVLVPGKTSAVVLLTN